VGLTTLLPSVSRLSRQCGILNISQQYRPPRPVTGIVFDSVIPASTGCFVISCTLDSAIDFIKIRSKAMPVPGSGGL
jgi:hypothetical protein